MYHHKGNVLQSIAHSFWIGLSSVLDKQNMHNVYNNLYSANVDLSLQLLTLTAENGHIRLCQKLKMLQTIFTKLVGMQDRCELKQVLILSLAYSHSINVPFSVRKNKVCPFSVSVFQITLKVGGNWCRHKA